MNILENCKPENCFWLRNGQALKNGREMAQALKTIDNDTFRYHVNDQRNDFYNWIKDIYQDQKLAQKLQHCRSAQEMAHHINNRIREVEAEAKRQQKYAQKQEAKKAQPKEALSSSPSGSTHAPSHAINVRKQSWYDDRAFSLGGTAVAMAVLIGTLALIPLLQNPGGITGATTATTYESGLSSGDYTINFIAVGIALATVSFVAIRSFYLKRNLRLP